MIFSLKIREENLIAFRFCILLLGKESRSIVFKILMYFNKV